MEAGAGRSSSNELSSAPNSDIETPPIQRTSLHLTAPGRSSLTSNDSIASHQKQNGIGDADAGSRASAGTFSAATDEIRQDVGPIKIRKPRKKKEAATVETEKKEKPARKPRSDKGIPKKKLKLEHVTDCTDDTPRVGTPLAQPKDSAKQPTQASPHLSSTTPLPVRDDSAKTTQIGISRQTLVYQSPRPNSADPKPITSPQQAPARTTAIYDPVRSSLTVQRSVANSSRPTDTPPVTHTPSRPMSNPSASPSISSIIHPPAASTYSPAAPKPYQPLPDDNQLRKFNPTSESAAPSEMEIDSPKPTQIEARIPSVPSKISPEGSSKAPSPKPTRAKERTPPAPPGSGLLSSSLFGAEAKLDGQAPGGQVPNIVLHVDLKGKSNQVINFAKMAEDKYGFAALYPRQAAQQDRLAKVAAAGAALERSANSSRMGGSMAESGDEDVSVDIDRDSDNEGDVNMSGVNGHETGGNSGTDTAAPKQKRRKKLEEYDQDDPFVDDSELLWEAQAAASKDGFFVYCGPLVPEGEKAAVERADGTLKRGRGRGRGGGPGSRGGRGGGAAAAGGGDAVGSKMGATSTRGAAATRKPRITKADRAQREMEKANREKMAPLAAKPTTFPA